MSSAFNMVNFNYACPLLCEEVHQSSFNTICEEHWHDVSSYFYMSRHSHQSNVYVS